MTSGPRFRTVRRVGRGPATEEPTVNDQHRDPASDETSGRRRRGLGRLGGAGRRGAVLRGGALLSVVGLLGVGMMVGDRFQAQPSRMTDGSAWVGSEDDLVHGSSVTGRGDWIVSDVGAEAAISQDGRDAMVVVNGRAFGLSATTLAPTKATLPASDTAVSLVRGGKGYLISDGRISCVDPQTFERVGKPLTVPGRVSGVVDDKGRLWVALARNGEVHRIDDCKVDLRAEVFDAGHDVVLGLAGGKVIAYDRTAGEVAWLDARTGSPKVRATVPKEGLLQGPSSRGDRAWISGPGRTLTGVGRDGKVVTLELSIGELRRPEVIAGRVLVPSKLGKVVVVDAPAGEKPSELGVKALPQAKADDFTSFVNDDRAWYSAPASGKSGTIASDGEIQQLEIDKEELEKKVDELPETPAEVPEVTTPPQPVETPTPTSAPPTPDPSRSTPLTTPATQPATTSTTPTLQPAPGASSTTTTTTTRPEVKVEVPDVKGLAPTAACDKLAEAQLTCTAVPFDVAGSPLDQVIEQTLAAGSEAKPGDGVEVRFFGSRTVPALVGLDGDQACGLIQEADLICKKVDADSPVPVRPKGVYEQSQPANTKVSAHTEITIGADAANWTATVDCRAPTSYETQIRPAGQCPAGWESWEMGLIADRPGAGRIPIHWWVPKPAILADPNEGLDSQRITRESANPDTRTFDSNGILGYAYPTQVGDSRSLLVAFGAKPQSRDDGVGDWIHFIDGVVTPPGNQDRPYAGTDVINEPIAWTWRNP